MSLRWARYAARMANWKLHTNGGLKTCSYGKPGKTTLEWMLEKCGMRVWTGFNWLRIERPVEISYEHGNWPSGSMKSIWETVISQRPLSTESVLETFVCLLFKVTLLCSRLFLCDMRQWHLTSVHIRVTSYSCASLRRLGWIIMRQTPICTTVAFPLDAG